MLNARFIAIGAAIWALSMFLAAPNLRGLADMGADPLRYLVFEQQVADPFVRQVEAVWEGDFLGYRILIPSIAHALGVPAPAAIAMIWLCGVIALSLVFSWLESHTTRRTAWLGTIALSLTPVIEGSNAYIGFPDVVGWMMIAGLIVLRSPAWWAVCTFAMGFNDERGWVALPLALAVVLFDQRARWPELRRESAPIIAAIAIGFVAALAGRWGLASGVIGGAPLADGLLPMSAGFNMPNLAHLVGLILSFKWLWIVLIAACSLAVREHNARIYWLAIIAYTGLAILLLGRMLDFWRSLAAVFPLMLIALRLLHEQREPFLRRALPLIALGMMLLPQFQQWGTQVEWLRPLPLAIYEWRTNRSLVDMWQPRHPADLDRGR